jgi:hypothetical protein
LFSVIAFPHRNDVSSAAARDPDNHHHAPGQVSHRLNPHLAVVVSTVSVVEPTAAKDVPSIGKVNRSIA